MSRTMRSYPDWYITSEKSGRDKKPFFKPTKEFKRARRQKERAKVKDALRHIEVEEEVLPVIRKNDQWDWN